MKTVERWLVELFPENIISLSQSKRVVCQGFVSINGQQVTDFHQQIDLKHGDVIELGKTRKVVDE